MKLWRWSQVVCAIAAIAGVFQPAVARSQAGTSLVGFWTQVSGNVTHDYAFTQDGRFESKLYGSLVYQVGYGTYTVQGDQLTMNAPQTAPTKYRWRIVTSPQRALMLIDSFGASIPFYWDKWDQRYAAGPLVPYAKASLVGNWVVNHGRMHWEYAFTSDGRFRSKRIGDAINETVEGSYLVKENVLILTSANKPLQGFAWRIEAENGGRTLILLDTYGAFEVYYLATAGS